MERNDVVLIGSDHAAFDLKERIKAFVTGMGYGVKDVGAHSEKAVDYADIGAEVAAAISKGIHDRGILLCGTGLGMSMIANRFRRVRAALCNDLFAVTMSRRHNDANILVLGGRVTGEALALEMVRVWFETPFDGGRHGPRVEKLDLMAENG